MGYHHVDGSMMTHITSADLANASPMPPEMMARAFPHGAPQGFTPMVVAGSHPTFGEKMHGLGEKMHDKFHHTSSSEYQGASMPGYQSGMPIPSEYQGGAMPMSTTGMGAEAVGLPLKIIYRHYATLYFIFVVDSAESELGILDLIQVFVQVLDTCFENVCELDLIYHFDRVNFILDELVMSGMVVETNADLVVQAVKEAKALEAEGSFLGL